MRRLMVFGLLLVALVACGRWRPAQPRVLDLRDPALAHRAAVEAVRSTGHRVVENLPERGSLVVLSKVDQPAGATRPPAPGDKTATWIYLQAYADGSLHITAMGRLVKREEQVVHVKLAREIDDLLHRVEHYARAMAGEAPGAVPPSPAVLAPGQPAPPPVAPPARPTEAPPAPATPAAPPSGAPPPTATP